MTLTEKVAYLKGLVDGLDIDAATKEGKIIKAMVDILDDMALTISDLEDEVADLDEQVELIDEDLDTLEEDYYSLFDDIDEDDCDGDCDSCCECDGDCDDCDCEDDCDDCDCGHAHGHHDCDCCGDDDEELYEVECPKCGDLVYIDGEMLDAGSIACPNCKELLEFVTDCDCDDCKND